MEGYVSVTHEMYLYDSSTEPYDNDWLSKPWYATIYKKDKQFYNAVGKVEHKTPVKVIGQELTDWDHTTCSYSGFLLVERIDNGQSLYISVTDFIVEPYWENIDTNRIDYTNPCLAVYHQKSDYYPVSRDNKRYRINDGDIVFINSNTQGVGGIDSTIYSVDVIGNNGNLKLWRGYARKEYKNIHGIEGKKFCEAYYDKNGKIIFDTGHSKIDLELLLKQA